MNDKVEIHSAYSNFHVNKSQANSQAMSSKLEIQSNPSKIYENNEMIHKKPTIVKTEKKDGPEIKCSYNLKKRNLPQVCSSTQHWGNLTGGIDENNARFFSLKNNIINEKLEVSEKAKGFENEKGKKPYFDSNQVDSKNSNLHFGINKKPQKIKQKKILELFEIKASEEAGLQEKNREDIQPKDTSKNEKNFNNAYLKKNTKKKSNLLKYNKKHNIIPKKVHFALDIEPTESNTNNDQEENYREQYNMQLMKSKINEAISPQIINKSSLKSKTGDNIRTAKPEKKPENLQLDAKYRKSFYLVIAWQSQSETIVIYNKYFFGMFVITLCNEKNQDLEIYSKEFYYGIGLIVGVYYFGSAQANLSRGLFKDFNKKNQLCYLHILNFINVFQIFVDDKIIFLVSRFILGYYCELINCITSEFIYQITPKIYRKKSFDVQRIFCAIGVLVLIIVACIDKGDNLTWRIYSCFQLIPALIFVILSFTKFKRFRYPVDLLQENDEIQFENMLLDYIDYQEILELKDNVKNFCMRNIKSYNKTHFFKELKFCILFGVIQSLTFANCFWNFLLVILYKKDQNIFKRKFLFASLLIWYLISSSLYSRIKSKTNKKCNYLFSLQICCIYWFFVGFTYKDDDFSLLAGCCFAFVAVHAVCTEVYKSMLYSSGYYRLVRYGSFLHNICNVLSIIFVLYSLQKFDNQKGTSIIMGFIVIVVFILAIFVIGYNRTIENSQKIYVKTTFDQGSFNEKKNQDNFGNNYEASSLQSKITDPNTTKE